METMGKFLRRVAFAAGLERESVLSRRLGEPAQASAGRGGSNLCRLRPGDRCPNSKHIAAKIGLGPFFPPRNSEPAFGPRGPEKLEAA